MNMSDRGIFWAMSPSRQNTTRVEGTNVFFEFLKDGVPVDALDFLE